MFKKIFIEAIGRKKKVRVSYYSKSEKEDLVRTCAPKDYGPVSRFQNKGDYYHLWNYEGYPKPHPMFLSVAQVHNIKVLDEKFDPAEFAKQGKIWQISRDWGEFS
jgi:hypothetical protein